MQQLIEHSFDLADLLDHGAAMVEATAEAGVAAAVVAGEVVPVALEVLAAMAPVVKWPPEVATSVAAEAVPVGVVEVPLTNQLPTITEDATHSTKLLCLFLQNIVAPPSPLYFKLNIMVLLYCPP